MRLLKKFIADRRAEMDEAVFVLPVMLLVTFALINFGLLGWASNVASNAANYGARMGSVAQQDPGAVAYSAAMSKVGDEMAGDYSVTVSGGGQPGAVIRVVVTYSVPNYFGPFAGLFGVATPSTLSGEASATFRQEGW